MSRLDGHSRRELVSQSRMHGRHVNEHWRTANPTCNRGKERKKERKKKTGVELERESQRELSSLSDRSRTYCRGRERAKEDRSYL